MKVYKFGAIDIGSNALRLLFTNVIENRGKVSFKKSSLIRMPIRLGAEVFSTGVIPQRKIDKLLHALLAFKHLLYLQDVVSYKIYATSAMRDAKNSKDIVRTMREFADMNIEIIDGEQEAKIIYKNQINTLSDDGNYLFIDVGGGSTEFTLFSKQMAVLSKSFNIGTVRIIQDMYEKQTLVDMENWIGDLCKEYTDINVIGSGGNINKIAKMYVPGKQVLSYKKLNTAIEKISAYSVKERIEVLGLNPDRADVIIPAAELYAMVMRWVDAKKIIVPGFGLADGTIRQLYKEYKAML
ncbi:MAG: Ppx/GppA family phosphatase [Bacteroidales bacterium]|jgi:exopolyphosphatase/guanosine-5'-triphosphate,3'-diphosphate pyrophosphatase|nr:Ppx/GppA family phosphatase [Bacteroidales bacterium]